MNLRLSGAAVKASYLIANEIASGSKPYSDGEFAKTNSVMLLLSGYYAMIFLVRPS